MAKIPAAFPDSVWDGQTVNRSRRDADIHPDSRDWDRISAEVIATQEALSGVSGSPIQLTTVPDAGTPASEDATIIENLQARVLQLEAILIAKGMALEAEEE